MIFFSSFPLHQKVRARYNMLNTSQIIHMNDTSIGRYRKTSMAYFQSFMLAYFESLTISSYKWMNERISFVYSQKEDIMTEQEICHEWHGKKNLISTEIYFVFSLERRSSGRFWFYIICIYMLKNNNNNNQLKGKKSRTVVTKHRRCNNDSNH